MKKYSLCSILVALFLLSFVGMLQADLNNGLVAYYPFNGNADDESGNGSNGTVSGGLDYITGKFDQAAYFDEYSDYVSIPILGLSNEVTVFGWFYADLPATDNYIVFLSQATNYNERQQMSIVRAVTGAYRVDVSQRMGGVWKNGYQVDATEKVIENSWNSICFVSSAGFSGDNKIKVYINGLKLDDDPADAWVDSSVAG